MPASAGLNNRLFSLSANGRVQQFDVAWQEVKAYPWLGSGAGTYDVYWFQHRQLGFTVHDVHNLYLEALAELGPVGLLLLVGVLVVPLVAAFRARANALAAAALGAFDGLPFLVGGPQRRLGEAQAGANDFAAARVSFRKAIAKEPKDWTLWFDLAQVSSGSTQRIALAHTLRLNPRSPEIAAWKASHQ